MTVTIIFESADTFYHLQSHLDELPAFCRRPFEMAEPLTDGATTPFPDQTVVTLGSDQDAQLLEEWCRAQYATSEPLLKGKWSRAIANVVDGRRVSPREHRHSSATEGERP